MSSLSSLRCVSTNPDDKAGQVNLEYKLHPVVVLSVLDHFKRRASNQSRVVGTLLGERRGDVVYIKSSFPVPHQEDEEQVAVDMDYHRTMLQLHHQVYPKQVVVGWYSTGQNITYLSALIHEVYRNEASSSSGGSISEPIHLCVDCTLSRPQMNLKAYTASTVAVNGRDILSRFEVAPLEMHAYEAEKIGVDAIINGVPEEGNTTLDAPASLLGDIDNLEHAMIRLLESIETCAAYVESVARGERSGDRDLGEAIAAALSQVPHIDTSDLNSMFTTHLQDLLMLVYLANMTHTQVNVADKVAQLIQ